MTISATTAPPNSLVLISDPNSSEVPETMSGELFASTESCVAVGCRADADGETEFIMGSSKDVDPGDDPAFQGVITAPTNMVAIQSVLGETILEFPVYKAHASIKVWVNDASEPDRIIVGID